MSTTPGTSWRAVLLSTAIAAFMLIAVLPIRGDAAEAAGIVYEITPTSGPPGTQVAFSGSGCPPRPADAYGDYDGVFVFFWWPEGNWSGQLQAPFNSEADGTFSGTVTIPAEGPTGPLMPGEYATTLNCFREDDPSVNHTFLLTTGPGAPGGLFDGNPSTTQRVDRTSGTEAAALISQARFAADAAAHVVLSRDDAFPDSLAGATLTDRGPLLFTETAALSEATLGEIRRVLPAGGRVYLLGGEAAISGAVAGRLAGEGFDVVRLAGASRVETAVAIADTVRALNPGERRVGLARAFGVAGNETAGWADSVTGGGRAASKGVPILVTPTERVHPTVQAWLEGNQPSQTVLFGGTAALSADVEASVPAPRRVSGPERAATAAAIATELWGAPATGLRPFTVISGFRPDGWMLGLAAAGPAADAGAPLLVTTDTTVPEATASLVSECGPPLVDLLLVGSENVISTAIEGELDRLDGGAC